MKLTVKVAMNTGSVRQYHVSVMADRLRKAVNEESILIESSEVQGAK